MVSYKTNVWYNLSCLQQTFYCLSSNKKLLVSWQFSGPYGVTKYGSSWRKDIVNQCLEFVVKEGGGYMETEVTSSEGQGGLRKPS